MVIKIQDSLPAKKHLRNSLGTIARETFAGTNEGKRTRSIKRGALIKCLKNDQA
jgi:hypothetical protein